MGFAVLWLILAVAVGLYADRRNRSGIGWFFFAALLSPLLGAIILLAIGPGEAAGIRKCPHCAEDVKAEALICKHCHQPLTPVSAPAAATDVVSPQAEPFTPAERAEFSTRERKTLIAMGLAVVFVMATIGLAALMPQRTGTDTSSTALTQKLPADFADTDEERAAACRQVRRLVNRALDEFAVDLKGETCGEFALSARAGGWDGEFTTPLKIDGAERAEMIRLRLERRASDSTYRLCRIEYLGRTETPEYC